MKTSDRIASMASAFGASAKSLVKIALQSRRVTIKKHEAGDGSIVILANGPSLRQTIAEYSELLRNTDTMAVNFAANTPEFQMLKPAFYILADPHFFLSDEQNVRSLWQNLSKAEWPITLYVPATFRHKALTLAPGMHTETFNAVGIEGFDTLCPAAFRRGLGMPRPRNVLIPAIMTALKAGFRSIYLTGADHSWLRTLSVNENNELESVQPHFYSEDKREQTRVATHYKGVFLHEILESFRVAFRSYHEIARFADKQGAAIYNATPDSFIDAFPRRSLSELIRD